MAHTPTAVVKTLHAGAPGTRRHVERHGDDLVCVRQREDLTTGGRLTTVELIIHRRPPTTTPDALVRVGYAETELRQRIKAAGGRWVAEKRLWQVTRATVRSLGLAARVVAEK